MGLLEQPVIIESGKREKRKVERLSMTEAYNTTNQPKEIDIPDGVGEKLGDIPRGEQWWSILKWKSFKRKQMLILNSSEVFQIRLNLGLNKFVFR